MLMDNFPNEITMLYIEHLSNNQINAIRRVCKKYDSIGSDIIRKREEEQKINLLISNILLSLHGPIIQNALYSHTVKKGCANKNWKAKSDESVKQINRNGSDQLVYINLENINVAIIKGTYTTCESICPCLDDLNKLNKLNKQKNCKSIALLKFRAINKELTVNEVDDAARPAKRQKIITSLNPPTLSDYERIINPPFQMRPYLYDTYAFDYICLDEFREEYKLLPIKLNKAVDELNAQRAALFTNYINDK